MSSVTDRVDNDEDDETVAALGLGELADLTVYNEADISAYDVRILASLTDPISPLILLFFLFLRATAYML